MDDSLTTAEIQLRAVSLYDAVLKEMDRLVAGLASYKWPSESQLLRARRVAIGILIIHSLHVSKAIAALLHVKLGNQTLILVRSQFEMAPYSNRGAHGNILGIWKYPGGSSIKVVTKFGDYDRKTFSFTGATISIAP